MSQAADQEPVPGDTSQLEGSDVEDEDEKHYLASWYVQTRDRMLYPKAKAVVAAVRFKKLLARPVDIQPEVQLSAPQPLPYLGERYSGDWRPQNRPDDPVAAKTRLQSDYHRFRHEYPYSDAESHDFSDDGSCRNSQLCRSTHELSHEVAEYRRQLIFQAQSNQARRDRRTRRSKDKR